MRLATSATAARASLRGLLRRRLLAGALLAACGDGSGGAPPGPEAEPAEPRAVAPWVPGPPANLTRVDLAGTWQAWLDPGAVGLRDDWTTDLTQRRPPATAPGSAFALQVPGPIEATEGTLLYDGLFWLARDVEVPDAAPGTRAALAFDQVNDVCRAWWDGDDLGEHEGGYDAFAFELSAQQASPGVHRLVLMVLDTGPLETLGRRLPAVPHAKEDWYENFGGVVGTVSLELRRGWVATELLLLARGAPNELDVSLRLAAPRGTGGGLAPVTLRAEGSVDGRRVADLGAWSGPARIAPDGTADVHATLALDSWAPRWSPESPALLELHVAVDGARVATRRFGLRHFEARDGDLLLDGRRRVLKGVLWQPHFTGYAGMTPTAGELEAEAHAMRAAGFDLVRAHVRPAPPAFLDACDRAGLMVLEEPAIGWVEDDPGLPPRLQREVEWMVRRDGHHPSIVMWGLLNELSGRAYRHADALVARVAELDPTRAVLRDSGGFLGARFRPAGAAAEEPLTDAHLYPPWPLPPDRRDELATLGAGAPGPTLASEFGYGSLLDADLAVEGFQARSVRSEESGRFRSFARLAQRARESGEALTALAPGGDWQDEAAAEQAAALVDMADALRSGPDLDLLCVTQWRAASAESSAGLLDPWGEERPALAALREALAPLRVSVLPERPTWLAGDEVRARVALVNDSGAARSGHATLQWTMRSGAREAQGTLELGAVDVPPGVSGRDVTLALPADAPASGTLVLVARLAAAEVHVSAPAHVTLVEPPALPADLQAALGPLPQPRVWAPPLEAEARDFLLRHGLLAERPYRASVALLSHPERLGSGLSFDERMALWTTVLRGGVAVVLLADPAADDMGKLTGAARGVRTLFELPRPVAVTPAGGHFSGRFHVLLTHGGARLLGRGDEVLSPVAMVAGEPPAGSRARLVTLGFLGNAIGEPWLEVPFGAGAVQVIGLPLLAPVRGAPDPLREQWLAQRLHDALREATLGAPARRAAWEEATGRTLPETWTPLPPGEAEDLRRGFALLDQLVAMGDRATPYLGGGEEPALPQPLQELLARRLDALTQLLLGDSPAARETLRAAVEPLWTEETRAFLASEARVLEALSGLAAEGPGAWDRAWEGVNAWSRSLSAWFGGRRGEAFDWLGRATVVLGLDPTPEEP